MIDLQRTLINPYLPAGTLTKALISSDASSKLREAFSSRGIELILAEPLETLPSPLSRHADMQLVNVCEGVFVYAPGIGQNLLEHLKDLGYRIIQGASIPGSCYPYDVAYNCAIVGQYAFLNPLCSDATLIETLKSCGKIILPVKQGYAKCSVCVISKEAIITADVSIHKRAGENGIDSLLIPPQKNIYLAGYHYGFIGGASGMISQNELALLGSFKTLTDQDNISLFLKKHGITPISMTQENLVDLGGVIPLCSV